MPRRKRIDATLLVLWLIGMVATSCARNDIYFEYRPVDPEAWSMDSVCTFAVEVHDTAPAYDLYLYTRNTPAYPYQNLWLFLNELSPDSTLVATPSSSTWPTIAANGSARAWEHGRKCPCCTGRPSASPPGHVHLHHPPRHAHRPVARHTRHRDAGGEAGVMHRCADDGTTRYPLLAH